MKNLNFLIRIDYGGKKLCQAFCAFPVITEGLRKEIIYIKDSFIKRLALIPGDFVWIIKDINIFGMF
jgi:hypothetical protein